MLLAGDIGGTKTVLALYPDDGNMREPLYSKRFPSDDYSSLTDIVAEFLETAPEQAERAIFGVAGPVIHNVARITNLPWHIDGDAMRDQFGWDRAVLLNDIAAIAHAIPVLDEDETVTLNKGVSVDRGALAIVAPGTGLGEGYLVWKGIRYRSLSSEGGHKSFSPNTDLQVELLRFLRPRLGHVSVERVCSGKGIPNLYAFLRDTGRYEEPTWLKDAIAAVDDPTPVIVTAGQAGTADIGCATIDLFVEILAGEAANMALQLLTTGGVYLGGGIPPRLVKELTAGDRFIKAFVDKGRFGELLSSIPVHIMLQPNAAQLGAAHYGLNYFAQSH